MNVRLPDTMQQLFVTGIRHHHAPVHVREQFVLTSEQASQALRHLMLDDAIAECAILSTCNRTEIYMTCQSVTSAQLSVARMYQVVKGLNIYDYNDCLFDEQGDAVASHLFRVASGLDSLILGESQILHQVKEALTQAQAQNTTGTFIDKLFKAALTTGKRVRCETGIESRDISVSHAAYDYVRKHYPNLFEQRVVMVGGGKVAEIALEAFANHLPQARKANLTVINRTASRLDYLYEQYGFAGKLWDALDDELAQADVVIVATGAPHTVLDASNFTGNRPLVVIDLSVPRNVDDAVRKIPGIQLVNIDDLATFSELKLDSQRELLERAEAIMLDECEKFFLWQINYPSNATITALLQKIEAIREEELLKQFGAAEHERAVVDRFSKSLVNKIFHQLLVRLRNADNPNDLQVRNEVLRYLFGLESLLPALDYTPASLPCNVTPLPHTGTHTSTQSVARNVSQLPRR